VRTLIIFSGAPLLLSVLAGCASTDTNSLDASDATAAQPQEASNEASPDSTSDSTDAQAQEVSSEASPDGTSPDVATPSEGGLLCVVVGDFPGAESSCQGEACPAGCACIEEGTPRHFACLCMVGRGDPGPVPLCITPTCGTIICEPPMWCAQATSCVPPEGGDASALDGGPLCSNDSGVFPGMPGICAGVPCAPGCACIAASTGGRCFCPIARPSDAGALCIAPTCGTIFCEPDCTCTDAVSGTCQCP
jgi:hypothetical protein